MTKVKFGCDVQPREASPAVLRGKNGQPAPVYSSRVHAPVTMPKPSSMKLIRGGWAPIAYLFVWRSRLVPYAKDPAGGSEIHGAGADVVEPLRSNPVRAPVGPPRRFCPRPVWIHRPTGTLPIFLLVSRRCNPGRRCSAPAVRDRLRASNGR